MVTSVSPVVQQVLIGLFVIFMMLTVGIDLTVDKLKAVFRTPRQVLLGLIINYLVTPAFVFGLVHALDVPTLWGAGILFVVAAPGGPVGAVLTQKAGGHLALSVSLMILMNCLNTILAPLLIWVMGALPNVANEPFPLWGMVRTILLFQILPLALSMGFRHRYEATALRIRPGLDKASRVVLGLVALGLLITEGRRLFIVPLPALLAINGAVIGALLIGWWLTPSGRADRIAMSLTTSMRSMSIVLLLLATWLPELDALLAALTYSGTMLVISWLAGKWMARSAS